MKKILLTSVIMFLPTFVFAYGGLMMDFEELQTGPEMMKYVEEGVLGDELHEEMEWLMTKMMSGEMAQEEAKRMIELMGQYPGPYGMMMVRLGASTELSRMSSPQVNQSGWNMMSGWNGMMGPGQVGFGWGGLWFWVFTLSWLVWTAAGVLLVVWLFRKLFSSK